MSKMEVLLFSSLRQKIGTHVLSVEVDEPLTGAELLDSLSKEHPVISAYRPVLRLAVNREYVTEDVSLTAGDEIALITPVSGG